MPNSANPALIKGNASNVEDAVDNDEADASSDNTFNSGTNTNACGEGTCSDVGYNDTQPTDQSTTGSVESDLALDALFSECLTEGQALPNRLAEAEQTSSSSWVGSEENHIFLPANPVTQTSDRETRSGLTVKMKRHDG